MYARAAEARAAAAAAGAVPLRERSQSGVADGAARKLASADWRREAAARGSPRDPARSVGRELDRLEAQLSEAEDALERT